MANSDLGRSSDPLRRRRFNAHPGYLGPIVLASVVVLAGLYMFFGDSLNTDMSHNPPQTDSTPVK